MAGKKGMKMVNISDADRERRQGQLTVTNEDVAKSSLPAPDMEQLENFISKGQRKYASKEEFDKAVLEYFKSCMTPVFDGNNIMTGMRWTRKPTLGSLAVALNIHRDTLHTWSKSGEHSDTIKTARGIIAAFTEDLLIEGRNPVGAINSLLNLDVGWIQDQRQIKIEPVAPDNGAKSADEITAFLDERALPESDEG